MPTGGRPGRPSASGAAALGPRQCRHLAALVAELGSSWSVELHDDTPGGATIVIQPADTDDPLDLAIFVHAAGSSFHLHELCGDSFRKIGENLSWADVLRAVRITLLAEMPIPPMLH
jgi:hypothetical protein